MDKKMSSLKNLHKYLLDHNTSLSLKKQQKIQTICPYCGKPLIQYFVRPNQEMYRGSEKWYAKTDTQEYIYFDGDAVNLSTFFIRNVDADLSVGYCPHCKEELMGLTIFLTQKATDEAALWIGVESEFVKNTVYVKQYGIFGDDMQYIGRLLLYQGVLDEGKIENLYRIDIDGIVYSTDIKERYGVCNGHFSNSEQKEVWDMASEICQNFYLRIFQEQLHILGRNETLLKRRYIVWMKELIYQIFGA